MQLLERWRESERRSRERRVRAAAAVGRAAGGADRAAAGGARRRSPAGLAIKADRQPAEPRGCRRPRSPRSPRPAIASGELRSAARRDRRWSRSPTARSRRAPAAEDPERRRARPRLGVRPALATGVVSFAVVNSEGKLRGRRGGSPLPGGERGQGDAARGRAAAPEAGGRGDRLDHGLAADAMITVSDNEAADAIYARVGDARARSASPSAPG